MSELRIIYTPEAENFRLDRLEMCADGSFRFVDSPSSQRLRNSYKQLRTKIGDLPQKVGVATYDMVTKSYFRGRKPNLENPTTTYFPLDIFENVLALKGEDITNYLTANYVYREMASLFLHYSIMQDPRFGLYAPLLCILPIEQNLMQVLQSVIELGKEKGAEEIIEPLKEALEDFQKIWNFGKIEELYKIILREFEQNRISRKFPLLYIPRGLTKPELSVTSLADVTEMPDHMRKLAKMLGDAEPVLQRLRNENPGMMVDRFGDTAFVGSLESLLHSLPSPKTIITDIYVVTQFPEIAKIQFSTEEFRLEG